jgi:hypothetical protein
VQAMGRRWIVFQVEVAQIAAAAAAATTPILPHTFKV